MADISKIQLPNGNTYNISDKKQKVTSSASKMYLTGVDPVNDGIPTSAVEGKANTKVSATNGIITADGYKISGGASSSFLKADGSTDSTAYLPLAGGTMTGDGPINFALNKIAMNFRPSADDYTSKILYATHADEALILANKYARTSYIFKCGLDLTNGYDWRTITNPTLQLKKQSVYINKLSENNTEPTHNLVVSGTSRFEGSVNVTDAAANTGCTMTYNATTKAIDFVF